MPFQPTLPTWLALNSVNSASPSGFSDLRTGQPVFAGGLNLGDYFDLTEAEANQISNTAVGTLHTGRYRLVQVDPAATAANVKTGTIGGMKTLAGGVNLVTDAAHVLALGLRPVVFLNPITPGNYGFVQELGDAAVLTGATLTKAIALGDIINMTATGVVDDPTVQNYVASTIGVATTVAAINSLVRVLLELPVLQG